MATAQQVPSDEAAHTASRRCWCWQRPEPGSTKLLELQDVHTAEKVATHLASKGFTVEQALRFFYEHQTQGLLDEETTTAEVVSRLVIPQTAAQQCCYMDGVFMQALGGPQKATRLVSHAWKSLFVNTVRNIVMDAGDLAADDEAFSIQTNSGRRKPRPLDAEALLQRFRGTEVLKRTYWLCIFAVNEHRGICGDCRQCNGQPSWIGQPRQHLAADPCLLCQQPKWNPCPCGSTKTKPSDPWYEIDKFDYVVRQMQALVVSLDSHMETVTRVWVVAEIGEAVSTVPVYFRLANELGSRPRELLIAGKPLVPSVTLCDATSQEDKERILAKIRRAPGGLEAYDAFVQLMLDMRFARCIRLGSVPEAANEALKKVQHACLDGSWHKELANVAEMLGSGAEFCRLALLKLDVSFALCVRLVDIGELSVALRTQKDHLRDLRLGFFRCKQLGDMAEGSEAGGVAGLGEALVLLRRLERLDLNFQNTKVADRGVGALGCGIPAGLREMKVNLVLCKEVANAGVEALARGLPSGLEHLTLLLGFTKVGDAGAAALGLGLQSASALAELALDLSSTKVSDSGVEALARGFPAGLRDLYLDLGPSQVGDGGAEAIGRGLPKTLQSLTLRLRTTKVGDGTVEALGQGLPASLRRLELLLTSSQVGDRGAKALGRGLPAGLRELALDLIATQVGDEGAVALAEGLPEGLEQLRLGLQETQVGNATAEALALRLPAPLRELKLELNGTQVGDRGLEALGRGLPAGLGELLLELEQTQVGDSGVEALGQSLPQGLERLTVMLKSTKVTDSGAEALARGLPPGLQGLLLVLGDVQVSKDCLQRLRSQVCQTVGHGARVDIQ